MGDLVVRHERGNLSVTFRLSRFITDWERARNEFIAGIAQHFRDLLSPQPDDFSTASSSELGEAWCKYRIFGGSSTIILRADSLSLSFSNIVNADLVVIGDLFRGTMERLLPKLQCYERQDYTMFLNHHAQVIEGDLHSYFKHHGSKDFGAVAESEAALEYRPIVGFSLRNSDGSRMFRRAIEHSEVFPNGLFITDSGHVSMPRLTEMDEELSWTKQAAQLVNRASGLEHKGNEHDDD